MPLSLIYFSFIARLGRGHEKSHSYHLILCAILFLSEITIEKSLHFLRLIFFFERVLCFCNLFCLPNYFLLISMKLINRNSESNLIETWRNNLFTSRASQPIIQSAY